jgi:hypothetical protein
MKTSISVKITMIGIYICALILALMPFHAFLTVWASTSLGHYALLRIWKEILIILLLPCIGYLLYRNKWLWKEAKQAWLFRLFALYIGLHILLGVIALMKNQVNSTALVDGLILNLRLVVFFFVTWVLTSISPWLRVHARSLLLIPAVIVVVFGLLQAFALPAGFLGHFGYSSATIAAYQTVNHDMHFVRVQSTLRGSDPLGAYLVVIISVLAVLLAGHIVREKWQRYALMASLVASLVVLYFTYSRSAYIGTVLSLGVIGWCALRSRRAKRILVISGLCVCLVGCVSVLALRHNSRFESTFFHTDQHSLALHSSNQAHASALEGGIHDVIHEPLGRGPGTAGPASVHNDQPARIAENYYLQIGQEVGWLGLFLFLAINVLVTRQLWERRDDWLALALLSSLVGISFVNLLSHAWADDTLSLVWWGMAGVALAVTRVRPEKNLTK